jgi:branched-chain amino acid transport system substrate-binding protein
MKYLGRWLVVLAVLALVMAACNGADDTAQPDVPAAPTDPDAEPDDAVDREERGVVTIGLLNPDTGPFAALGEDVDDGFELYLEENDGMLSGYRIETVKEDEACDTAVALERAQQMVERDNVDMIIGLVCTPVAYGVSGYIQDSGVPLLITVAGANDLTQRQAADNIFRISYTGSSDSQPIGEYMCNELGHATAAVVALDFGFGWEAAGGFASTYEEAGCEVVQELYVPLQTTDWAPFVQQIDRSADAVWAVAPGPDGVRLVQAYRDFGIDLPLVGHGVLTDEIELEQQQANAEGIITSLHYSAALDTGLNQRFAEAFRERHGRSVSRYVEVGYAAGQVLEAALARIEGEVTYASMIEALGTVEIEAPRGPIRFDEFGQAVYNIYIREVQQVDGEWRNVVIDTIEDVNQFWSYDPDEYMSRPTFEELKGTWTTN